MEPLKVTIVGGGIAGLVAARVLREHHSVTVLERSKSHNQIGAGLGVTPPGMRILDGLGFDRKRAQTMPYHNARSFNINRELLAMHDFEPDKTNTEGGSVLVHRVDLWWECHRLATTDSASLGIQGEPATVLFDVEVVDIDVESGDVFLRDGTKIESDLIIGADGVTSFCRPYVIQQEHFRRARPAGTSAFRFIMPADTLQQIHPGIHTLDRTKNLATDIYLDPTGSKRTVVSYPLRNYQEVNFAFIVPDEMVPRETTASWSAEGTREDLMRCFDDSGPFLKSIISKASNIKLWQLRDHDPLPTYTRGRMILIGDSAHAMTPHQGQGANQAIEDAEAFSLFNDPKVDRAKVPDILNLIDSIRRPRASKIQGFSRAAQSRTRSQEIFQHQLYNNSYPGIKECLARVEKGQEAIAVS